MSDAQGVHRYGVVATFPEHVAKVLANMRDRLAAEPFAAWEADTLAANGLSERYLATAVGTGLLLKIGDGVFLLPDAPALAIERIAALPQPFTLSEARQALGTTRRVAVPLLELLDRQGTTRRVDTTHRTVRRGGTDGR